MKSSISIFFEVPEMVYKILDMVAEQDNNVKLYCMGGNEILLAGNLPEVEDCEDEDEDWEDIEDEDEGDLELFKKNVKWEDLDLDFEDDSWWNKDLPF
ncbi:hypothetical protein HZF24_06420 [Sedimentibacter hydroxybenzoicus DSM 7310]|uniref:Uncharacterized protein n=1 Tax=Sedimentibacter hydroxybenzoicus DSM 7310 TaxID=1123245 RepID=A0A974BIF3_SEDHY|nr:hypothetical protein [Sedimentibacter hydroxybenzoicus]NYB73774.1 hypothetical protein [Sedimentibacter hydroxybenzoicus DSM 7310]